MSQNPQNRITFLLKDEQGNGHSMVSLPREAVLEAVYNIVEGRLLLVLTSFKGVGTTDVEPVRNVSVNSQGGRPVKKQLDGYTTRELYSYSVSNNQATIEDQGDIKRIWEWLGHDQECPAEDLFKMRQDMLDRIQKEKEEREKAAKEAEEKAATPPILDKNGNPIQKEESVTEQDPAPEQAPVIAITQESK